MWKILLIAFVGVMLLTACGGSEEATEPVLTGTISGFIYDAETSLPIALSNVTSVPPTSAVTTDTTGTYAILNVDPETYVISASKIGYITGTSNISVSAGNETIADVFLDKDSTKFVLK